MERMLEKVVNWLPQLLAALALVVAAWFVARIVRYLVRRALRNSEVDQRWGDGEPEGAEGASMSMTKTLSDGAYWIVFLLFVPFILDVLGLRSLLDPFREMAQGFLAFLPNLVGASLILVVGWFVARFIRRVVTSVLISAGVDRFSERIGIERRMGEHGLSNLIGVITYVVLLVPVGIAALSALNLAAVTEPASAMLNDLLVALPALFGAGVVVAVAYAVGKVVGGIVGQVLAAMGFDSLFERMGLTSSEVKRATAEALSTESESTETTSMTPSSAVGSLAFAAIIVVGIMGGLRLLGFTVLEEMLADFMVFAGQILVGLAIFGVGLLLANWVSGLVTASDTRHPGVLAQFARAAILILAGAMALRQMGLANEIIVLAFAFIVGAVAIAAGIAFGVGGREVASDLLTEWRDRMEQDDERKRPPTAAE